MPDRRPSSPRFPGTFLWCLFAFVAGVLLTRAGWLPGGSRGPEATFGEAWQLVEQKYVDQKAVQRGPMTQGAIRGMLESLGDTGHTGYLTASQFEEFSKVLKGEFEGIGARLTIRKGEPTIVHTFPNSPARSTACSPAMCSKKWTERACAGYRSKRSWSWCAARQAAQSIYVSFGPDAPTRWTSTLPAQGGVSRR